MSRSVFPIKAIQPCLPNLLYRERDGIVTGKLSEARIMTNLL
jgi:hypothetical protein